MATTHTEFLAVILAVALLHNYLKGVCSMISTNLEAIRWIITIAPTTEKLARWHLRLSEFELDIVHLSGIKHKAADVLSRSKVKIEDKTALDDEVPVLTISQPYLACVTYTEMIYLKFIKEPRSRLEPIIPQFCGRAVITGKSRGNTYLSWIYFCTGHWYGLPFRLYVYW